MRSHEPEQLEEPNIVPLIDVGLVLLVMVLTLASVGGRLLPLALPKAEKTTFLEMNQATLLRVIEDGSYRLAEEGPLSRDQLATQIAKLSEGSIVLVSMDPKAKYEAMIWAVDHMMGLPSLQVAFGQPGQPTVKAGPAPAEGPEGTAPAGGAAPAPPAGGTAPAPPAGGTAPAPPAGP